MTDKKAIALYPREEFVIFPSGAFNFNGTVWKPSHFPSCLECFDGQALRFTLRLGDDVFGVRLSEVSEAIPRAVSVRIYSHDAVAPDTLARIKKELSWRFDLDSNLDPFLKMARADPLLRPVVKRWGGMRIKCALSLPELLVVSVVLQNATVRRSVQMLDALLSNYGTWVTFDGARLGAFWSVDRLANEPEEVLRGLRLGYRARTVIRQARDLQDPLLDELHLRSLPSRESRDRLLQIYGVGPASVGILLFEVLNDYDSLDYIGPWEQKIYSRLLFDKPLASERAILVRARKWKPWRMLAFHYLFEDLFWRHSIRRVDWLAPLIRL